MSESTVIEADKAGNKEEKRKQFEQFSKLSKEERRLRNRKLRKQKKMELKTQFLDNLEHPKVYSHAGKRCVVPYWHDFKCHARHRWVDQPLLETLLTEFAGSTPEFLRASIEKGRMKLNDKVVTEEDFEHLLQLKDTIHHKIHRHEPPVLDIPITVLPNIATNPRSDVTALNKPPSIPVHPCGGYNFNSLLRIMLLPPLSLPKTLQPVHRLDKLTSGVVVFADSPQACSELFTEISGRTVSKTYIALVHGLLGSIGDEILVDAPLWSCPAGKLIGRVDHENGKPSFTKVTVLAQNENSTLVKCKPTTGRTHQIRIHLQSLGFPIIGDPLYQLQKEDENMTDNQYEYMHKKIPVQEDYLSDPNQSFNSAEYTFEKDEICLKCQNVIPDLQLSHMYMCLHSIYYSGNGWSFFADAPFWATELMPADNIKNDVVNC